MLRVNYFTHSKYSIYFKWLPEGVSLSAVTYGIQLHATAYFQIHFSRLDGLRQIVRPAPRASTIPKISQTAPRLGRLTVCATKPAQVSSKQSCATSHFSVLFQPYRYPNSGVPKWRRCAGQNGSSQAHISRPQGASQVPFQLSARINSARRWRSPNSTRSM